MTLLPPKAARFLLQRRIRKLLNGRDVSILSANCIGAKLSEIAGEPYRSPTVGLWFSASDFIKFATDLDLYSKLDLIHDADDSAQRGYPVGALGDVKIKFMHYSTFAEAREKWLRRAARINRNQLLLVLTDRDGASVEHFARFDTLPHPKLLFVSKPLPNLRSALWVRDGNEPDQVGDLTTDYHHLFPVLSRSLLRRLCEALDSKAQAA
jgi:uncharacterized protein (DUF1919 family)